MRISVGLTQQLFLTVFDRMEKKTTSETTKGSRRRSSVMATFTHLKKRIRELMGFYNSSAVSIKGRRFHLCRASSQGQSPIPVSLMTRRNAHVDCIALLSLTCSWVSAFPASAGLVQFPCRHLSNTYVLIRAGESEAQSEGKVLTNPVAKTSMTNGLSAKGKRQIVKQTYSALRELGACENSCWLYPSMTLNAYQSGEILGSLFGIGRNRIVPEFSKLDARGVGALEGAQTDAVSTVLIAGDETAADWKPPPGDSGTPNESPLDVMTRGRELLSLLETQYNGETVLLISPDSDNLSILQAAVAGVDLRAHRRRFAFEPGEARFLGLSELERDDSPMTLPCPRPPLCK